MEAREAAPLDIAQLLGGMLVAVLVAFMLYGVTTAQAYIYFLNCKGDPKWMKVLVGCVWFLETSHSAFVLRQLYYMVIISFGDFDSIGRIDWSLACMTLMEILIILLVEGYYIWRIWILSNRSRILCVVLAILLVCRLGFTACTGIYTLLAGTWVTFQGTFGPNFSVIMTNSFSAVIDSLIAITMMILLRPSQMGFNYRMDSVVRWIIMYTVNTGAISMVISVVIAITYSTLKENLIFAGLVILTGKLYANALLGMLNARHLMRRLVTISVDPNILGFSGFNVSYPTEHQDNGSRDPHLVYGNAQSPRLARSAPEPIMVINEVPGNVPQKTKGLIGEGSPVLPSPPPRSLRQGKRPPSSPSSTMMMIEVERSVEVRMDV